MKLKRPFFRFPLGRGSVLLFLELGLLFNGGFVLRKCRELEISLKLKRLQDILPGKSQ